MDAINIIREEKAYALRRRNRTVLRLRLCSGIRAAVMRPWKSIPVLMMCAAFTFLWCIRDTLIRPFYNGVPLLTTIYSYLIAILLALFFALLLVGLLFLLGTPFRAKSVENSLSQIGLVNRYGHAPALVSCKRIKGTNVSAMAFYSLGVGLERWKKQSEEVQDALDVHFVEPIQYGGRNERKRNIIVITAAPGAPIRREDTLYDDEL